MLRSILAVCVVVFTATTTHAQSQTSNDQSAWGLGLGNNSCGQYIRAADSERKLKPGGSLSRAYYDIAYFGYLSFMEGYITALNSAGTQFRFVGAKSDDDALMAWLDNYCHAHPLENFLTAVYYLREELIRTGQ